MKSGTRKLLGGEWDCEECSIKMRNHTMGR